MVQTKESINSDAGVGQVIGKDRQVKALGADCVGRLAADVVGKGRVGRVLVGDGTQCL